MTYDILIVGGGPAGLTAAIYGARAGKTVALIERESIGGQIVYSPHVENYPGLPGISGSELANRLYEQVEALGVEVISEEVQQAERADGGGFTLKTDYGSHTGRTLILATGVQHRRLGLPGEEELVGSGVSYCAVCDGAFYAGRDVAVVGGGDTALQDALFLSGVCRSVTVAGLVTGGDLIAQLRGRDLGERLLISADMLRRDEADFLDSVPLSAAAEALGVPIYPVACDGGALCDAMFGSLPPIPAPLPQAEETEYNKYN